ncbi:MAG: response regulator [Acidobacteriota bacterium]
MAYKILVVDDESATAFGLKALMETEEVKVLTATSLQSAKRILEREKVDVLLTDIRLTGTLGSEGLELLEFTKANYPDTRVILMTGYGDPAVMEKAHKLGADCYFEKPVELGRLSETIWSFGVPNKLGGGNT